MPEFDLQLTSRSYLSTGEFAFYHPDSDWARQGTGEQSRIRLNLRAPPLLLSRNLFECTELLLQTAVNWEDEERAFRLIMEATLHATGAERLADALARAAGDERMGAHGRETVTVAAHETAIELGICETTGDPPTEHGQLSERDGGDIVVRRDGESQVTVLITSPTDQDISVWEALTLESTTAQECAAALRQGARAIHLAQRPNDQAPPWMCLYRGTGVNNGETTGPAQLVRTETATDGQTTAAELVGADDITSGDIVVMDHFDHQLCRRLENAAGYVIQEEVGMIDAGAVLARMYEMPAVTTCPNICDRIDTGDRVAIQGKNGSIIHDSPV